MALHTNLSLLCECRGAPVFLATLKAAASLNAAFFCCVIEHGCGVMNAGVHIFSERH